MKILLFVDAIKHFKETEKDEVPEIKHNFEADIYLEKLDHETEKVSLTNKLFGLSTSHRLNYHKELKSRIKEFLQYSSLLENRTIRQQRHLRDIFSASSCRRAHSSEQSGRLLARLYKAEYSNDKQ